jgi:undecaprenyl-diphosphatase
MALLSHINDYGLVWMALLVMFAGLGERNGLGCITRFFNTSEEANPTTKAIIPASAAQRPVLLLPDVRLLVCPPNSYSFPSVNATYAFAVSSGASLATRRLLGRVPFWGWGSLTLAVSTFYSRIYVDVHYPSDVLGGAILGVAVGWLAAFMVTRLGKDEALQRLPNSH